MVKKILVRPRAAQRTVKTRVLVGVETKDIGRRAYDLFLERGSRHGHDIEDWLLAEAELRRSQ